MYLSTTTNLLILYYYILRNFDQTSNAIKSLLCAAEAAFEAGGSLEQALIILSEPGTNTAVHGQPDSVNAVLASEGASSSLSNIAENQEMLDTLDDEGGSSIGEEDRDSVMEDELARELNGATAVSDYDMDVTKEGEAITEYLGLLDSMMNSENA